MCATRRSILLLTAAVLIGGCASTSPYLEARKRHEELGCDQYGTVNWPRYAEAFGVEEIPAECLNRPPRKALVGYERVSIYDAETGRTMSAIIPAGTVIVK